MARERLIIVGTGAQARAALNAARLAGISVVGCVEPSSGGAISPAPSIDGAPLLGDLGALTSFPATGSLRVLAAFGEQRANKREVVEHLSRLGYRFHTVIHPQACIAASASVGTGCIVYAGVVIEPRTEIGDHVTIRAGCTVSHDIRLGDFVSLGPGVTIAGGAVIGAGAVLHTGAVVTPDVVVEELAVVGAGAVVLDDVPAGVTVVGVPARPLEAP